MIGDITRGSDVVAHRARLLFAAFLRAVLAGIAAFAILFWAFWPFGDSNEAGWWSKFHIAQIAYEQGWDKPQFSTRSGSLLTPAELIQMRNVDEELRSRLDELDDNIVTLVYWTVGLACLVFILFYVYGRALAQPMHIRGAWIGSAFWVRLRLYITFATGDIRLPGLPLPKQAEVKHFSVEGTTGSGKSSLYIYLLNQVRALGQRAVVYDPTGSYSRRFYRPGRDILLHPFAAEFPGWNLSNEIRNVTDYAALAKSMIPEQPGGDGGYWFEAARRLASSLFEKLDGESNLKLFQAVQTLPLEELVELVKGLPATAVMDITSPKTAASVRATLATKFDAWRHLKDGPFSIRNWAEREHDDSWIFIVSRPEERDFLRPLVSLWIDCAVRSVMALAEDNDRRIWLALDELPSLQQLPSLRVAMAEGRKFGLCCLLGYQSWPQLVELYGPNGAAAIESVARTKVVMACGDALTAQHCAETLGKADQVEPQENLSWGVSTNRDGVSLQPHRTERWVVTPTELMQLPDLRAFVRIPGPYPVVPITIPLPDGISSQAAIQLGTSPSTKFRTSQVKPSDPIAGAFGFDGGGA
ncbi:MAG: type IV secretion system DNA-binding domain-containing protein [Nitrospira sp.]|nr:type IV secretion system DNA-binding domain-containing protein [Nitrospira sp.]